MEKKTTEKHKGVDPKKRNLVLVGVGIIVLILLVAQFTTPKRSVAAYCDVYKEEKARLAKFPGDTWPSGVFNEALSDAGEFVTSFDRLEKVAPDDIKNDVETLRQLYKKMKDDPSSAIAASLSGAGAESSVKKWTKDHCGVDLR